MATDPLDEMAINIAKQQIELSRLKRLKAAYPDLVKHVNRWKTERWCSKSANTLVNDYEYRHNCGCCADSPLEIWPYLETPDGRVYSDPPVFRVGHLNWNHHDTPEPGWQNSMLKYGIPQAIVDRLGRALGPSEDVKEDEDPSGEGDGGIWEDSQPII